MYTKLEEAMKLIDEARELIYNGNFAHGTANLRLAKRQILEYIEEGYRLSTENNPLGN